MKDVLIKRIGQLALAIADATQKVAQSQADLNMMRGQKHEAESMLTHMINSENQAAAAAAVPAEPSTPSAES